MYYNLDFPYADGEYANEIDISVDEFTQCIEDRNGKEHDVCFKYVQYNIGNKEDDAYEQQWLFDWHAEQQLPNVEIYDMYLIDQSVDCEIQGRIAINTNSQPLYVMLVENAPQNSKLSNNPNGARNCNYIGCGRNLFSFACLLSKEEFGDGQILWKSKTNLIEHYIKNMGASLTRNLNEMWLSPERAEDLINECHPVYGGIQYE